MGGSNTQPGTLSMVTGYRWWRPTWEIHICLSSWFLRSVPTFETKKKKLLAPTSTRSDHGHDQNNILFVLPPFFSLFGLVLFLTLLPSLGGFVIMSSPSGIGDGVAVAPASHCRLYSTVGCLVRATNRRSRSRSRANTTSMYVRTSTFELTVGSTFCSWKLHSIQCFVMELEANAYIWYLSHSLSQWCLDFWLLYVLELVGRVTKSGHGDSGYLFYCTVATSS